MIIILNFSDNNNKNSNNTLWKVLSGLIQRDDTVNF